MRNKKNLKGFTLTELIVVIAIIGILSAILGLSWINYIASSRIKTQNSNSRVIFNASQTVAQEYKFKERKLESTERDIDNGDFYFYWNGSSGSVIDSAGNVVTADAVFVNQFASKINKIFSGSAETVYKIHIKDYLVQSVISARNDIDNYKGSYPTNQTERNNDSLKGFDMSTIE